MKKSKRLISTIKNRFYSKVLMPNESGCMLWIGAKTLKSDKGYGEFRIKGKRKLAHHFSYELYNGKIKKGLLVLHKCDIRNCIAPEHLFLGTAQDNAIDRNKKRRNHEPSGEDQYLSSFTNNQVKEIRQRYKKESITMRKLASIYNTTQPTINNLINYKTYKNI